MIKASKEKLICISIFFMAVALLATVLMVRKFSDNIDLLLNPIVYCVILTHVVAILNLAINFNSFSNELSARVIWRGMLVLLISSFLVGGSFPSIYLITSELGQIVAISAIILTLLLMLLSTLAKINKMDSKIFQLSNRIVNEKKASDFIDERLSIMHNLPAPILILIVVLALIGYNTLRAFPILSGACILLSLGFLALTGYQFAFASWLVAKRLKKLN